MVAKGVIGRLWGLCVWCDVTINGDKQLMQTASPDGQNQRSERVPLCAELSSVGLDQYLRKTCKNSIADSGATVEERTTMLTWDDHTLGVLGLPRPDSAMAGCRQAEEGLRSPMAEEQGRDPSPMVTCHFACDYDVSRTSPRQAAATTGPGMGLALPSSETLAYETGLEHNTPRKDRNRAGRLLQMRGKW